MVVPVVDARGRPVAGEVPALVDGDDAGLVLGEVAAHLERAGPVPHPGRGAEDPVVARDPRERHDARLAAAAVPVRGPHRVGQPVVGGVVRGGVGRRRDGEQREDDDEDPTTHAIGVGRECPSRDVGPAMLDGETTRPGSRPAAASHARAGCRATASRRAQRRGRRARAGRSRGSRPRRRSRRQRPRPSRCRSRAGWRRSPATPARTSRRSSAPRTRRSRRRSPPEAEAAPPPGLRRAPARARVRRAPPAPAPARGR